MPLGRVEYELTGARTLPFVRATGPLVGPAIEAFREEDADVSRDRIDFAFILFSHHNNKTLRDAEHLP